MREPPKVISSCVTAADASSHSAPPASATSRAASSATNEPRRLSRAREVSRPFGELDRLARRSPRRRRSAPARAPHRRRARRCRCAGRGCSATFLRSSSRSRWTGFLPTTPVIGPSRVSSTTPLADEDLGVPAADRPEPQIALVVDVGHDQPDLVDVAHDHQASRGLLEPVLGRHPRERRAQDVGADLGEVARRLQPDAPGSALVAGGSARREQVEQNLRSAGRRLRRRVLSGRSSASSIRRTYCRMPPWRK